MFVGWKEDRRVEDGLLESKERVGKGTSGRGVGESSVTRGRIVRGERREGREERAHLQLIDVFLLHRS